MKAILTECLLSARHWGYRNDTEVALALSFIYYIFSGPVCLELGAREEQKLGRVSEVPKLTT